MCQSKLECLALKANEDNIRVVFGRVFHFKLGSFVIMQKVYAVHMRPYLKLKTWPRFCPAS